MFSVLAVLSQILSKTMKNVDFINLICAGSNVQNKLA